MPATIHTYPAQDLPESLSLAASALQFSVWPGDENIEQSHEKFLARHRERPDRRIILALEGDTVLAHAEVFSREILCGSEPLRVGCLAGVCVSPDRRGEHLGKAVVEAALAASRGDGLPLVLFQTGVPEFYRRLGAVRVHNRFINSLAEDPRASPWWDEYVMIHPGDYPWPRGVVDLQGSAF